MAVTIQTIQGGSRNITLNLYIAGANTTQLVYDSASAFDPNLSLVEAQWSLTGDRAQLLWDATTDDVLIDMCAGNGFFVLEDSPIPNPRSSGVTNDIFLTNSASVTNGTVILKFKKSA